MSAAIGARPRHGVWLGAAVLLVALSLRGAIVSISPVLDALRAGTGMSASAAGLLIAVPLICFGASASLAPRVARRLGMERTLLITMLLAALGILVRLARLLDLCALGHQLVPRSSSTTTRSAKRGSSFSTTSVWNGVAGVLVEQVPGLVVGDQGPLPRLAVLAGIEVADRRLGAFHI